MFKFELGQQVKVEGETVGVITGRAEYTIGENNYFVYTPSLTNLEDNDWHPESKITEV